MNIYLYSTHHKLFHVGSGICFYFMCSFVFIGGGGSCFCFFSLFLGYYHVFSVFRVLVFSPPAAAIFLFFVLLCFRVLCFLYFVVVCVFILFILFCLFLCFHAFSTSSVVSFGLVLSHFSLIPWLI